MDFEELLKGLLQFKEDAPELMKQKVSAVYSGDESILLDLCVNAAGTKLVFIPDYSEE